MAGAQESNLIPQKYTYRQDQEPTNPKAGSVWVDTSGNNVETNLYDEATDSWELLTARGPDQPEYPVLGSLWRDTGRGLLTQYNGASFTTVGNSIDDDSITKDGSGDLQVNPDVRGAGWDFVEEQNFTSSNTLNINIPSDTNAVRIIGRIYNLDGLGFSGEGTFNGNTDSNYSYIDDQGNYSSGVPSLDFIVSVSNSPDYILLDVTLSFDGSSTVFLRNNSAHRSSGYVHTGEYSGLSSNLSTFELSGGSSVDADIKVYKR